MNEQSNTTWYQGLAASNSKEKFFFAVKIIIAAGLLFYLYTKVGSVQIVELFEKANYYYVGAALLLMIPNLYSQYYKWRILCESTMGEKNKGKIVRSLFYGFAGGAFTPAQIGMFFGRRLAFPGRAMLEVVTASLIDKLFTLFIILFGGSAAAVLYIHFYTDLSALFTFAIAAATLSILILLGYFILSEQFWNGFVYQSLKKLPFIRNHLDKLSLLKSVDKKTTGMLLLTSFLFYLCFVAQYALLVMAFTDNHSLVHFLWAGALVSFVKAMIPSISIGELGVREGASIYFLAGFGLAEEAGFNAAFSLFLINVLLPSLAGFILLFRRNK